MTERELRTAIQSQLPEAPTNAQDEAIEWCVRAVAPIIKRHKTGNQLASEVIDRLRAQLAAAHTEIAQLQERGAMLLAMTDGDIARLAREWAAARRYYYQLVNDFKRPHTERIPALTVALMADREAERRLLANIA